MTPHPLDNAVWHSLGDAHRAHAQRHGDAARYAPDASVFAALPDEPTERSWADLATLVGPGGQAVLFRRTIERPAGWELVRDLPGVQLVAAAGIGAPDPEAGPVTAADVEEATALVEATRPGPWAPRTIELGRFVGLRRGGRLVALAGQRLQPAGHVEISAVCTDPAHRGQGLAARLVRDLVHGIQAAGSVAFIQAAADNVGAVRLYERLGFALRTEVMVEVVRPRPGDVRT